MDDATSSKLPLPAKAGILVALIAGAAALLHWIRPEGKTVLVVLVGIAVIALFVATVFFLLRWYRQRRGERAIGPGEVISSGAKATNDPKMRAELDDMRRKFEKALAEYRSRGKSLYSTPWYLLVGEPGSGKTEGMRYSNVKRPPGFDGYVPSPGGTFTMDWWFTSDGIILDTAGRLMFDKPEAGNAPDTWRDLLRLLKKARPDCPINGLILVIPADSLQGDSDDQVTEKARRIAARFDAVQRDLGVRFPVFVFITKSDLIAGFRTFFDDSMLSDLDLQQQMLGWSNPAPLDTPFDSAVIGQHLRTVRERLVHRRFNLLLDPVGRQGEPRINQVDELFVFPDELTKIESRLRRYLETIFVTGEWSNKPLFLRGIYFTCAIVKGAAYHTLLAQALNIDARDTARGQDVTFERKKSYFLREVFERKIFKEKGLVTPASSTRRLKRHNQFIILGTACSAAVLLLAMSWWGARSLEGAIGGQKTFWVAVRDFLDPDDGIVKKSNGEASYNGQEASGDVPRPGQLEKDQATKSQLTIAELPDASYQLANERIDPRMFKWLAVSNDLFATERADAHRVVAEEVVLRPLVERAVERMNIKPRDWAKTWGAGASTKPGASNSKPRGTPVTGGQVQTEQVARAALAQLIRVETSAIGGRLPDDARPPVDLDALARYALNPAEYQDYQQDQNDLHKRKSDIQTVVNNTFAKGRSIPQDWLMDETKQLAPAIDVGIHEFNDYWKGPAARSRTAATTAPTAGPQGTAADRFDDLEKLLRQYGDATGKYEKSEDSMVERLQDQLPAEGDPKTLNLITYNKLSDMWEEGFKSLQEQAKRLNELQASIKAALADLGVGKDPADVMKLANDLSAHEKKDLEDAYEQLLRETRPDGSQATAGSGDEGASRYAAQHRSLLMEGQRLAEDAFTVRSANLAKDLTKEINSYYASAGDPRDDRLAIYDPVQRLRQAEKPAEASRAELWDQLGAKVGAVKAASEDAIAAIRKANGRANDHDSGGRFTKAKDLALLLVRLESRYRRYLLINQAVHGDYTADVFSSMVKELTDGKAMPSPFIPLSRGLDRQDNVFDARFDYKAVRRLLASMKAAQQELGEKKDSAVARDELQKDFDALCRDLCRDYLRPYFDYWVDVSEQAKFKESSSWDEFRAEIKRMDRHAINDINDNLSQADRMVIDALSPIFQQFYTDFSGSMSKDLPGMNELLEAENKELMALEKSDRIQRNARDTADAWHTLIHDSGREAAAKIGGLTAKDFNDSFLVSYYDDVAFWRAFCKAAVKLLARAGEADLQKEWQKLIQVDAKMFPICRDAPHLTPENCLRPADIDTIWNTVRRLGGALAAEEPRGGINLASGDRRSAIPPEISVELERLFGKGVILPREQALFRKIYRVAESLQGLDNKRLTYEVVFAETKTLMADQWNKVPGQFTGIADEANDRFKQVDVQSAHQNLLRCSLRNRENEAGKSAGPLEFGAVPPVALTFEFHGDAGEPRQSVSFDSDWTILTRLCDQTDVVQPTPDDKHVPAGALWLMALTVPGDKPKFCWIGVRFSRPLPALDEWPTVKDFSDLADPAAQ